jgi:hypothetical protein
MITRDTTLTWSPLPEANSQPTILPYQWIVHTAVDGPGPTDLGNYFERASVPLESHTWLRWTFHEQFMPFNRRADANYKANRFLKDGKYRGAISTETEDDGTPVERPWNNYQINELIRFGLWLHRTYGIPVAIPRTWDSPGMGWHSLFPNQWTNVAGKTCPGSTRINQFKNVVLPGIRKLLVNPEPKEDEEEMGYYLYLKDNRDPNKDYGSIKDVNEKGLVSGVKVYYVVGNIGVQQSANSMEIAESIAAFSKAPLTTVGTPTNPVELIDPDGQVNGWFNGCYLIDGPMAGIKK